MIRKRIHLPLTIIICLSICFTSCRGGRAFRAAERAEHEVSETERDVLTIIEKLEPGAKGLAIASEDVSKFAIWASRAYSVRPGGYSPEEFFSIHRPYKSVDVFAVLPDSAKEFKKIYKREPTFPQLRNLERANDKYRDLVEKTGIRVHQKGFTKASFIKYLEESDAENHVVIGHNENGQFYFPNGDSLALAKIVDLSKEHNTRCIYLSCEAGKHITTPLATYSNLTQDQAIDITKRISDLLKENDELFLKVEIDAVRTGKNPYLIREGAMIYTVGKAIEEFEKNRNRKRVVKWVFTGSAAIGIGVILIED
jgi:hypothetical protein